MPAWSGRVKSLKTRGQSVGLWLAPHPIDGGERRVRRPVDSFEPREVGGSLDKARARGEVGALSGRPVSGVAGGGRETEGRARLATDGESSGDRGAKRGHERIREHRDVFPADPRVPALPGQGSRQGRRPATAARGRVPAVRGGSGPSRDVEAGSRVVPRVRWQRATASGGQSVGSQLSRGGGLLNSPPSTRASGPRPSARARPPG